MFCFTGCLMRIFLILLFVFTSCTSTNEKKENAYNKILVENRRSQRQFEDSLNKKLKNLEIRLLALNSRLNKMEERLKKSSVLEPPNLKVVHLSDEDLRSTSEQTPDSVNKEQSDNNLSNRREEPVLIKLHENSPKVNTKRKVKKFKSNRNKHGAVVTSKYKEAKRLYKENQYQAAIDIFDDLLLKHGEHGLLDNSLFFKGLCLFDKGDYIKSISTLQDLPVLYPKSPKIPDTLFYIGKAYIAINDSVSAKVFFTQLIKQYPKTKAANKAFDFIQ